MLNEGVNNVKLLRKWLGEELQAMDSAADRMWKRYVRQLDDMNVAMRRRERVEHIYVS